MIHKKKVTNYDRIHNMTQKQLTEFMSDIYGRRRCRLCQNYDSELKEELKEICHGVIEKWLQEESR